MYTGIRGVRMRVDANVEKPETPCSVARVRVGHVGVGTTSGSCSSDAAPPVRVRRSIVVVLSVAGAAKNHVLLQSPLHAAVRVRACVVMGLIVHDDN